MDGRKILMPDLLLAINSAADSNILAEVKKQLKRRRIKMLSGPQRPDQLRCAPPDLGDLPVPTGRRAHSSR